MHAHIRNRTLAACLIAAAVATGGCAPPPTRPTARPRPATDACADRMHQLIEPILLYYATHRTLPPSVSALKATGGPGTPPLVCPISGKPYVYTPQGLHVPSRAGIVVLYDSVPAHWNRRWAILVKLPAGRGVLSARVVLLPENDFPASQ